jgi:inosine-uridine nucleoside N-ribohydrolase
MIRWKTLYLAGLILFNLILRLHPTAAAPLPSDAVVIDTDMAVDDVMAITALLGSGDIHIQAITTVEGSASLASGTRNLLSILDELGFGHIPVAGGGAASTDVPVEAPPWRTFADTLGGITLFPPLSEPYPGGAEALLEKILRPANDKSVTLLCLGPLTNIAALLEKHPDLKKKVAQLVVQADLGTCSGGFNLFWDKKAAEKVFSGGLDIVCIGGAVMNQMQLTPAYFEAVTSKSTGVAPLFRAMFHTRGEALMQGHFKLWDPVTACYLVRPDCFRLERKPRRLYDREVTCAMASKVKKNQVLEVLAGLWSGVAIIEEADHLHGFEDVRIPPIDYVKAFHGHLGPYLMLGYRAGKLAVRKLNCRGHFDLEAAVHAAGKPPASCFIDGVQLGSGCSMGKKNITAHVSDRIFCVFTSGEGETITVSLKPDVPGRIRKEIAAHGVEPTGLFFYHLPDDAVFDIKQSASNTGPPPSHP